MSYNLVVLIAEVRLRELVHAPVIGIQPLLTVTKWVFLILDLQREPFLAINQADKSMKEISEKIAKQNCLGWL